MQKAITCLYKRPNASTRLIFFPWAGGGSIFFANWGRWFDESIEVYSVMLAGRESRSRESFAQNIDQIVDEVCEFLLPLLHEKSLAFFGHSFGSLTSFATAVRLKEKYGVEPIHLFVSGISAPHSELRLHTDKKSEKTDEDLLCWLSTAGGTPTAILQNKEALKMFIPAMKADLRIVESFMYEKPDGQVLSCGLTCFDGNEDTPHDLEGLKNKRASKAKRILRAWQQRTQKGP
uniref:S-acyl fatty acid synthase thioesterase, medium chain n=1 Tax=Leptobrachium leishanense TaxID=445787 RepID=A0A8C5QV64_9ANUR